MKDRIVKFLASEHISPAEFADKIGVQRSSMSHILNGRNYPSASFLQKMFQAYPSVNPRWLMIGDGSMNMDSMNSFSVNSSSLPDLNMEFNENSGSAPSVLNIDKNMLDFKINQAEEVEPTSFVTNNTVLGEKAVKTTNTPVQHQNENQFSPSSEPHNNLENPMNSGVSMPTISNEEKEIEKILFIYTDKTFSVYRPS